MSGLELLSLGAGVLGTGASAAGTIMGANASAAASEAQRPIDLLSGMYRAQSLRDAANNALGASQRTAMGATEQKNLVLSKAQSVAASSGGGANDATVTNLEAGIEKQGEYQKLTELYQGESQQNALNNEAQNALIGGINRSSADQYAADMARRQAPLQAAGTLLSGASTMFSRFGQRTMPDVSSGSTESDIGSMIDDRLSDYHRRYGEGKFIPTFG